jgi:branched-chain amino acid transport system substrate-binding protein
MASGLPLAACGSAAIPSGSGGSPASFTIGITTSLSGPLSSYGVQELKVTQFLVKQVDASGGLQGRQVKLISMDDGSDPTRAVSNARTLTSEKVDALLVGPLTSFMLAVTPIVRSTRTLTFGIGSGYVPPGNLPFFVPSATDTEAATVTAGYLADKGLTKVALLYANDSTGQPAQTALQQGIVNAAAQGRKITLTESIGFDPTSASVTPQLARIAQSGAQAIIAWTAGASASIVAKDYTQLGLASTIPLILSWANGSPDVAKSLGSLPPTNILTPLYKPVVFSQLPADAPYVKANKRGMAGLESAVGNQPMEPTAPVAYDVVHLMFKAMSSGSGSDAWTANMENIKKYQGLDGTYSFSATDHKGGEVGRDAFAPLDFLTMGKFTSAGGFELVSK